MIWTFPIAGRGSRTQKYGRFKPFVILKNKCILEWSINGIKHLIDRKDHFVFITTQEFYDAYDVRNRIKTIFVGNAISNDFEVVISEGTPAGPAASVYVAKRLLAVREPCIVINCDQFIVFEIQHDLDPFDSFLPVYFSNSPKSSYVVIEDGLIRSVHEKKMVSTSASAGVYGIGSGNALIWAIENLFKDKKTVKSEYYVGPAINYLIEKGGRSFPKKTYAKFDLGDESGIENFLKIRNIL